MPGDSPLKTLAQLKVRWPFLFGLRWYRQEKRHNLRAVLTQIEAIVRVNAPLPEGLLACSLDAPNRRTMSVLRALSETMESGASLADAMRQYGRWFPPHLIAQVRAGEDTGQLADAIKSLVENINAGLRTGRTFRNHVVYFAVIVGSELFVLSFVLFKVFPVFYEIFNEFGAGRMPVTARVMATITRGLQFAINQYWREIPFVLVLILILILVCRFIYRVSDTVQSLVIVLILQQRSAGNIFRDTRLQRISRTMELRLSAGEPLPEALRHAAAIGLPYPFRKMLSRCAATVERGEPLSKAFAEHRRLAGTQLSELVRLGETREDLAGAFGEAAKLLEQANRRRRHVWAEAVVPVGVALCAVGVFGVTVASFELFAAMADMLHSEL